MSSNPRADLNTRIDPIIQSIIAPAASETDRSSNFPRPAISALGEAGLLGLVSGNEVGGMGGAHRAAAQVIESVGRECASTAMVLCMHYCGAAVIEAFGPAAVRKAVAAGKHLTTLAFSETGSRSHFWAPVSTAASFGSDVRIDAKKSWSTSAGQVDSYVWSSKPMAVEGASTLWLMPGKAAGLKVGPPFDGMGLRGNHSTSVQAGGVTIHREAMLGSDGQGLEIMNNVVLPYFQVMNSAASLGICESVVAKTITHLTTARLEHLNQSLAEQPVARAGLATMRIKTDMLRTLLDDTVTALEAGREDAMLRVLEVKAAAGETATAVTDLAMRLCGGAAYRKDLGIERNFRDARASTIMAPTVDVLNDFIGKALTGLPLFG